MPKSIFQDVIDFFKFGNMVTKLILINLVVSVLYLLITVILKEDISKYVLLSTNLTWNIKHPWVFITSIFAHKNIISLIWNMFILHWFGSIIGDMIGDNKILPIYIMSSLLGVISYMLYFTLLGEVPNIFLNASITGIVSIIVASAVLVPDYKIRLLILGRISLGVLVIIYVAISLLYSFSSYNFEYVSLISGVFFGWYYIYALKKGKKIDKHFNGLINYLKLIFFSSRNNQKSKLNVRYKSDKAMSGYLDKNKKTNSISELDRILEKIKLKGYDKLSDSEKEFLFLASKK